MVTATYPVAPEVTPREGTLLDAATVKDGIGWLDGTDLWESFAAMQFGQSANFCAPNTKDLDNNSADWVSGFRFAAYGGVTCKAVGMDMSAQEASIREVFERGESTAVERALMQTRFRHDAGGRWDDAIDITPAGGAVKPGIGVGLLEGKFASLYTGAPTIHMPIVVASMLLGLDGATLEGGIIRSKLGSKIAAGAGYDYPNTSPGGVNSAEMERWVYATGGVVVLRGPAEVRQTFEQLNNDVIVLGERAYVVAVDGPTLALKVALA